MWFRTLSVYISNKPFPWSSAELNELLTSVPCPPISQQALSVDGFVTPLREDDRIVLESDHLLLGAWQETSRLLPAAVIKEELDERVQLIEDRDGRKPGRKERADLKDQITFELMPKAFTRSRRIPFMIDMLRHRILVDAPANRAEQVIAALRKAVGDLPVKPPGADHAPSAAMTAWLRAPDTLPGGITLGDRCELKADNEAGTSVRYTAIDLGNAEIMSQLDNGMAVVKLNLCWDDAFEFDLSDKLEIKRLRALDLLNEKMDSLDSEDAVSELLARISLQGSPLRMLLDRLLDFFTDTDQDAARAS